jgi:transposase
LHGLLALHGLWGVDLDDEASLAELVGPRGDGLPARLGAELDRELARLTLVRAQLKGLAAEGRAARRAASGTAARVRHLMTLKGIGPQTSTTLVHELFYRDFDNRRQVAAAAGLDPTPFASGGIRREQGIAKSGNRRVRRVMVEVAWLWLRYQPQSALSLWYGARVGENGRARRVMIVALARKLLVALWRYLETGLVPQGAVLKR